MTSDQMTSVVTVSQTVLVAVMVANAVMSYRIQKYRWTIAFSVLAGIIAAEAILLVLL